MMNRLKNALLSLYAAPYNFMLKRVSEDRRIALKDLLFAKLYAGEDFTFLSSYPRWVHGQSIKGTSGNFHDVALILQGPVLQKDDFTINSVKMYRQYYDGLHIIVSTWSDTPLAAINGLKAAGAEVLLNDYPPVNPEGNLNLQLTTSLAGVRRAGELGARFAAKTRTDQRFYNPCALPLLLGLYEDDKLILLGGVSNSYYSRPFNISDFFAFSSVGELEMLYQCSPDTEESADALRNAKQSDEFGKFRNQVLSAEANCEISVDKEFDDAVTRYACSEIRIAYEYFLRKKDVCDYPSVQAAYDAFLRDMVILVDAESLGFYWAKYLNQVIDMKYFQRTGRLDVAKWFELRNRDGRRIR